MQKCNLFIAVGLIGVISLVSAIAFAKGNSAQDFVQKVSIGNQFEIESSKLALEKAQNNDVKSFAQRMIDDHTKAGDRLKEVLQSSKSQAQPADKLDDKHQKLLGKLQATEASNFDSQYIAIQTDAHKETINLFTNYSKRGKDKELKSFADEMLPTLQDHLKNIQQLKVAPTNQ